MSALQVALKVGKNKGPASVKKSAIVGLGLMVLIASVSFGQTCTLSATGTVNWSNSPALACSEGGTANGKTILKIPAGLTVVFNSNDDTWSGTQIEVYGILNITASPTINSSIVVMDGGRLNISGKLSLGTSDPSCNYHLAVRTGGTVDVGGTGSDRLAICGVEIMKGNGTCNDCSGTFSGKCAYDGRPYCEPSGGFTGPTGYYEGGYDGTLPVKLLDFRAAAGEVINLAWTTVSEKDLVKFVIQRSENGIDFQDIGEVAGSGANTDNIETRYSFTDKAPLLGFNYYRLKSVDLDNTFEFLGLELVKFSGSKHMTVYPNPSSGDGFQVRTNFRPSENDQIVVRNPLGVDILKLAVNNFDGQITFENKLQPGVYVVTYVSADFKEVSRVIVRN